MNFTNTIAENYIASSILSEPERIIPKLLEQRIDQEYFHNHLPKIIWNKAIQLFKENRFHEIELLETTDLIKGQPNGKELGYEISKVRSEFCGWEIGKQHLLTLKKMYAVRFSYIHLQDTLSALDDGISPEEIVEASKLITQGVMDILESESGYKTARQSAEEFTELLIKIHNSKSSNGISSGIDLLDRYTGGLSENELWVVGAETSGGKTVLMFQMMASFLALGKNVLLFSLETEASRIHARLAANTQNINLGRILGTSLEPLIKSDIVKIKDYVDDVTKADCLTICDADSITLESITSKAEQLSNTGKSIDLIVVDYIQLVTLQSAKDKNRQEQVAEVSRTLKQLAKKHKCPVITATQLNDDGKVRESRAITHDADVFLRIGKDSDYIFIGKNRNGERNKQLDLTLNGGYQRFEE